jgi:hypothetical protein
MCHLEATNSLIALAKGRTMPVGTIPDGNETQNRPSDRGMSEPGSLLLVSASLGLLGSRKQQS